jgi:hypothetical protein
MSSAPLSPKFIELDLFNFWSLKLCCNHGVIDESVLRIIIDHLSNQSIDEQIDKHTNFKDKNFKKIIQAEYNRFVFPEKKFTKKSKSNGSGNDVLQVISGDGPHDLDGGGGGGPSHNNLSDNDPILKPQFIQAVVSAANVTDSTFTHLIAENGITHTTHPHNDKIDDDLDLDDEDNHSRISSSETVFSNELVEEDYDSGLLSHSTQQVKEKIPKIPKEKVVKEKVVKVPKEKVVKEKVVKVPKEKVVKEKVPKVPKEKVVKEKVVKEKVPKEKVVKEKVVKEKVVKEKVVKEKVPKEKVVKEKVVKEKVPKEKVVKEKVVKEKVVKEKVVKEKKGVKEKVVKEEKIVVASPAPCSPLERTTEIKQVIANWSVFDPEFLDAEQIDEVVRNALRLNLSNSQIHDNLYDFGKGYGILIDI